MNNQLSDAFASDTVRFSKTESGLVSVSIDNTLASAQILLQGAQVLSFAPQGKRDVLWLSADARYEVGRPVRGGVPICWPWFGALSGAPQAQAHGFARNRLWELGEVTELSCGATQLLFTLSGNSQNTDLWPHLFELTYRVVVGQSLELNLTTTNVDVTEWRFTEALHSYLAVESIAEARLHGLSGNPYQDKLSVDSDPVTQKGDVAVTGELDRIYRTDLNKASQDMFMLFDPKAERAIKVEQSGSASTVVWNPWVAKAQALADFSDAGYQTMLCVEAANTEPSAVRLKPGESHTLTQVLSLT